MAFRYIFKGSLQRFLGELKTKFPLGNDFLSVPVEIDAGITAGLSRTYEAMVSMIGIC